MMELQRSLFDDTVEPPATAEPLEQHVRGFRAEGRTTIEETLSAEIDDGGRVTIPAFVNEFWTSRQRAAHSLHEISYRACFKPQLPRFFITRLTRPGDLVYDPFMGRGTTVLEAALLGRVPAGCDVNPLSRILVEPRLQPPASADVARRLAQIDWGAHDEWPEDLLTFYHPDTLRELCALKAYLQRRAAAGDFDALDGWIRMVAVNRLTGHSPGFFSVYTLPPNQAASVAAQRKINRDRGQVPPRRNVPAIIVRKTKSLLNDCAADTAAALRATAAGSRLITARASHTPELADGSVDLVVTSPPFLDVVNYAADNWLRCWFCGIDPAGVRLSILRRITDWRDEMTEVLRELARVVRAGGHVAFEVGEVRAGTLRLEEHVVPCGIHAGLEPRFVLINAQQFTKTAACWGVDNNRKGTNSNRIVLFRRP